MAEEVQVEFYQDVPPPVRFNVDNDLEDAVDAAADREDLYRSNLFMLFDELRSQAVCNLEYYDGATGAVNERLYSAFGQLFEHLERGVESGVDFLLRAAPLFDYDSLHPGNGYRSVVTIIHRCCLRLVSLARYIVVNRESYLFRAEHYSRELDAYVTCLGQLRACLYYLQKLVLYCPDGNLVPDEDNLPAEDYQIAERLLKEVESLSQEAFYGRCLGFQYCQSMKRPLTTINLVLASYGHGYNNYSSRIMRLATSVYSGSKYLINPELRAKQIVTMTRSGDIQFCKAFWGLAENAFVHKVPLYMCPTVDVDHVVVIGSKTLNVPLISRSGVLEVSPLPEPVNVRLISTQLRTGQRMLWQLNGGKEPSDGTLAASNCLVIHCHGGGFVAQSSASHQVYLRNWAKELDCPVLCVDYSLAPERRFPCQLNEVFFAYCWAITNAHLLGTTAEHICVVGDSAGANLAVALAMRASASGIRQPDGVLSIYGCLLMKYTPSPSRILALLDPLLPIGVLSLCLHAYADETTDVKEMHAAVDNSRSIEKTVSSAVLDKYDSRTGAGVDRSMRSAINRNSDCHRPNNNLPQSVDNAQQRLASMLVAGAEAYDVERRGRSWRRRHEQLLAKSSSMPAFRTLAIPITKSVGQTLDDELVNLSTFAKLRHFTTSPLDNFKKGRISQSPFVSPLLADDDMLRSLCPIHLMACHLDPMLDDTVMFARRLRDLGNKVEVDFVEDLPHGFLNFVLVSPEAKAASDRCVSSLKRLLGMIAE